MKHPGEVLREEWLKPRGLSAAAVARAVGVPRIRIERVATEQAPITADTALRLARYFGTTPDFWINLQGRYDIERAEAEIGTALLRIRPATVGLITLQTNND